MFGPDRPARCCSLTTSAWHIQCIVSVFSTGKRFSASMLRVHRYTHDADYPPHCDLGLLTIAPRASVAGLLVQLPSTGEWIAVEEQMGPDEAIIFGGSTLSELCGIAALPHKVMCKGQLRFSAPYFLRASPGVTLPQPSEEVGESSRAKSVGEFVASKVDERRSIQEATLRAFNATVCKAELTSQSVEGQSEGTAVATPVAPSDALAKRPAVPGRIRQMFYRLDDGGDGRLTLSRLRDGFRIEFGDGLPQHAMEAIDARFERIAIGDLDCSALYVDRWLFSEMYVEVLFRRFDEDNDGFLNHDQTQEALKFLMRTPRDGAPKPDIPFACPPGSYTASGKLCLPLEWFSMLCRGMP